jgi:hypothetical protein
MRDIDGTGRQSLNRTPHRIAANSINPSSAASTARIASDLIKRLSCIEVNPRNASMSRDLFCCGEVGADGAAPASDLSIGLARRLVGSSPKVLCLDSLLRIALFIDASQVR